MLIYSERITSRLKYAAEIILEDYLGELSYTSNIEEYHKAVGHKIFYGNEIQCATGELQIIPFGLLFEKTIQPQIIQTGIWENCTTIFPSNGSVPFDIFSAAFYLISRYEEYLPDEKDVMGRFESRNSLASKFDFLHLPIIDTWRQKFISKIKAIWSSAAFKEMKYSFISSIDVDSAYAYRNKGLYRTLGGIVKDMGTLDFKNLRLRMSTLAGLRKDHYDTYSFLSDVHKKQHAHSLFFFLLGDFGKFDKNVPHTSPALRNLIREISSQSEVGIHPSVASNKSLEILSAEKQRLESIIGKKCFYSRQHYLILNFPETYFNLLTQGITDDYTMGYADNVGFRASTSRSFKWYDLAMENKTILNVHPFAVMDATLNNYLKYDADKAIEVCKELINAVKANGGNLITIWHNESLCEVGRWKGWRRVYIEMLSDALKNE